MWRWTVRDVYIALASQANARVVKVPAGGGAPTTVVSDLSAPGDVAVDSADNIYINNDLTVLKVPAELLRPR